MTIGKSLRVVRDSAKRCKRLRIELLEHRLLLAGDLWPQLDQQHLTDEEAYYARTVHHYDSPDVRISATGKAYYVDPAVPESARGENVIREMTVGSGEKIPLEQIPQFNSDPDAPNTFYLDFTGQVVGDTDWNVSNHGAQDIHAAPYDSDGDRTTFSEEEVEAITEICQRVSEDFLPFNINITTIEPPMSKFASGGGAIRAIITTNVDDQQMGGNGKVWFAGAGGVSYVASWLTPGDLPIWVFHNMLPQTAKAIAEATSHEFGHAVGLSHDGTSNSGYYTGHGEGETSWAPIMGSSYSANVTQWSKGDYLGANNHERDISIIANRINKIAIREDDHGNWEPDATPLKRNGAHVFGAGIITERHDLDFFSFEHPGGPINILVSPAEVGANLDVSAEIFDDDKNQLEVFSPLETLHAQLSAELAAGTYYLLVEGGDHIPPGGEEGYNEYGSLGQYTISGVLGTPSVTADAGGSGSGCPSCGAGPYTMNEGENLFLDGSGSFGRVDLVSYVWDVDGDGEFDDAVGETVLLTWAQLEQLDKPVNDDGSYTVALRVSDAAGNVDDDSAIVTIHNRPPSATISTQGGVLYAGKEISINVDASDIAEDSLTYTWDLGDGSPETVTTEPLITHAFNVGSYEVSVTVRDDEGGTTEVDLTLLINIDLPRVTGSSVRERDVLTATELVRIDFSDDVSASLNPSDLYFFDVVNNRIVNPPDPNVQWVTETNSAVFDINGVPTGRYSIVLTGAGVANTGGMRLDGDADGNEGGNWSANVIVTHRGDANFDRKVDFLDFLVVANSFGSVEADWENGDFDGNRIVSFADFLVVANNFGANESFFEPA